MFKDIVVYAAILLSLYQCQAATICFIGENLYGDYAPFLSKYDPRAVMGTYTQINITNQQSILSVDFNAAIYEHSNFGEDTSNYIFKISNIGWVISEFASPNTATTLDITATCFEDNIMDCTTNKWFAGYNSNQHSLCTVKITSGSCSTDICMNNFNMTVATDSSNTLYLLDGILKAISPEEPCTIDSSACESNNTYWINQNDNTYRWYCRVAKNRNWVYGRPGSDRIACAPGYVENPLFCTTFVYASHINDGSITDYIFKSGLCNSSVIGLCPTNNPTLHPTSAPTLNTRNPSISPTIYPSTGYPSKSPIIPVSTISPSKAPTPVIIDDILGNNGYKRKYIGLLCVICMYLFCV